MYKIIGGDQKEYGPVSAEQMRQWIAEGRAGAQTKAQAEGSADWRPLSAFPEFNDALAVQAGAPAAFITFQAEGARSAALQQVKAPATWLMVVGILGVVMSVLGLVIHVLATAGFEFLSPAHVPDPQIQALLNALGGTIGIISDFLGIGVSSIVILGAVKMKRLQNHQFAVVVSILAMLPCFSPCCLIGLPAGIWALVVLNRPEVKSQFS